MTNAQVKFVPTAAMISAAEAVFRAMAIEQTIGQVVKKYQRTILAEGKWPVRPEFRKRRGGEGPITDPNHAYLMSEEDFLVYDERCKAARIEAKLQVTKVENCPHLEAQTLLMLAKRELVDAMSSITGITNERAVTMLTTDYQNLVELTLRLLVPFVRNTLRSNPAGTGTDSLFV